MNNTCPRCGAEMVNRFNADDIKLSLVDRDLLENPAVVEWLGQVQSIVQETVVPGSDCVVCGFHIETINTVNPQ